MRKIIYSINTSIDGVYDHTKFNPDEQTLEYFTNLIGEVDTFLYGRKTFELMVPYWPDIAKNPAGQDKGDVDFARAFAAVRQIVVFSRTVDKLEGKNTRLIRTTSLRDDILKLKQEPGGNILLGGVDLAAQLIALDLVDEYRLVVHSLVVGEGERLFERIGLKDKLQLKLVDTKTFNGGSIALHYTKK